jgi:hypothetical protein
VVIALGSCLLAIVLRLPDRVFFELTHEDGLLSEAVSPDGKYVAKAWYFDGLTFGFDHMTLEERGWHPFGLGVDDPIEFVLEGFRELEWRDAKTPRVYFDGSKNTDPSEDTSFVRKPSHWREISIEYASMTP